MEGKRRNTPLRFNFDMARLNLPENKPEDKTADEKPKEKPKLSEADSDAMIAFLQKATKSMSTNEDNFSNFVMNHKKLQPKHKDHLFQLMNARDI